MQSTEGSCSDLIDDRQPFSGQVLWRILSAGPPCAVRTDDDFSILDDFRMFSEDGRGEADGRTEETTLEGL
jgi:hypothetical protein